MPGEAVPKHVAILSVIGKDFQVETIRLKTVRPFVMREIVLQEEKEAMKLAKKANNRVELTRFLTTIVNEMIEEANDEWEAAQGDEERDETEERPKPLIRLRVEYTAPEGGNFDCENPQRFSNRFNDKVANTSDVVQFYRKKSAAVRKSQSGADLPDESILASMALDSVKVEKLVREFLAAQSLTILPQNSFGDAVNQFIDKDDKHAMELFVSENLVKQVESLMNMDDVDEENILEAMEKEKSHLEELFASSGRTKRPGRAKRMARPDMWDSGENGPWEDQAAATLHFDSEYSEDTLVRPAKKPTTNGKAKAAPKKTAPPAKKSALVAKSSQGKKKVELDEDEDEDVVMLDDDDDEENDDYDDDDDDDDDNENQLFVKPAPPARGQKTAPAKAPAKAPVKAPAAKRAPARGVAAAKQSQLSFSQPSRGATKRAVQEIVDDEISDDDDAFEPAPTARSTRSRR